MNQENKYFCQSCGEMLNDQYGFNKYLKTWVCKKCGYENDVSRSESLGNGSVGYDTVTNVCNVITNSLDVIGKGINLYAKIKGYNSDYDEDDEEVEYVDQYGNPVDAMGNPLPVSEETEEYYEADEEGAAEEYAPEEAEGSNPEEAEDQE